MVCTEYEYVHITTCFYLQRLQVVQCRSFVTEVTEESGAQEIQVVKVVNIWEDYKGTGVWAYFLRHVDKSCAKCKLCGQIRKTLGGSTSGLHRHLDVCLPGWRKFKRTEEQNEDSAEAQQTGSAKPKPKQLKFTKVTDYFISSDDPCLDARLSRTAALHGISFYALSRATDIREGLEKLTGEKIPEWPTAIRNRVVKYGQTVQKTFAKNLQAHFENCGLFELLLIFSYCISQ